MVEWASLYERRERNKKSEWECVVVCVWCLTHVQPGGLYYQCNSHQSTVTAQPWWGCCSNTFLSLCSLLFLSDCNCFTLRIVTMNHTHTHAHTHTHTHTNLLLFAGEKVMLQMLKAVHSQWYYNLVWRVWELFKAAVCDLNLSVKL